MLTIADDELLLRAADAAEILGVSDTIVRRLHRQGRLRALMTVGGWRLFLRSDVEALAKERARAKAKRRKGD